jgi:hypothetical protein
MHLMIQLDTRLLQNSSKINGLRLVPPLGNAHA